MNKLIPFIRLDYVTIKPYVSFKNILIYAVLAVFLSVMSRSIASAIGVGLMLGTMFMSYPFASGEKSNMDALYSSLSVSRKTVVMGRYLFALLLNICACFICVVFGFVSGLVSRYFGLPDIGDSMFFVVVLLSAFFIFIQAIQLPIYFRLGYSKAKFFSLVPFVGIMAAYTLLTVIGRDGAFSQGLDQFFASFSNSALYKLAAAAALVLFIYGSYRLSLSWYKKREF